MSSTTCDILFYKNPKKIYFGGDTIKAKAILTLNKSKIVRGIYVIVEGIAHCQWKTKNHNNRKKSKQLNTGDEQYFSSKKYFVGGEEGQNVIPPGVYTFTFKCNLPQLLPTSVESKHGHIRYYLLFVIDHSAIPHQQFMAPFTVINTLYLNDIPELKESITRDTLIIKGKRSGCVCLCCNKSKQVQITGMLSIRGYVPDEKITIFTEIDNICINIYTFYIRIFKVVDFYANKSDIKVMKRDEIKMCERKIEGVRFTRKHQTFQTIIEIPTIAPTDILISNICKVHYILRISGENQLCCIKTGHLDIPIIIGTFPFYDLTSTAGSSNEKLDDTNHNDTIKLHHLNLNPVIRYDNFTESVLPAREITNFHDDYYYPLDVIAIDSSLGVIV